MRALVDPRLRHALPDHWPVIARIEVITYTADDANQQIPSGVQVIAGLEAVPARLGPIIQDRPTDDQERLIHATVTFKRRHLKLNGYYPSIPNEGAQAVVDNVAYPIRGVESDSQQFSTRLKLEVLYP
jgi:hypothetical protein